MLCEGRVAVVTGAAQGIGAAVAAVLAREGARVVVNHRPGDARGAAVVDQIRSTGGTAVAGPADLTDPAQVTALMARAESEYGRLDALVNNAAVTIYAHLPEVDDDVWERTLAINLTAAFRCTRAVIPLMAAAGGGRIVNVASMGVRAGSSVGPHYAASKGGLIAFTRTAAKELAGFGILVNCVSPPLTDTETGRRIWQVATPESVLPTLPLRRLAHPEEVAEVVTWLVSARNTYITGENLWISGGK